MRTIKWPLLILLAALFWACGGDKPEEQSAGATEESALAGSDNPMAAAQEAMKMAAEQMEQMQKNGETVEVTDYQTLKGKMPETLMGIPRENLSGQKSGAMGFKISHAEARYRDGDRSISVNLTDGGGIGYMKMATAAWSMTEMESEDDNGYERTTTVNGNKAFEKYEKDQKHAQLTVMIKDRYILNLDGKNITVDELKKAMNDLNLSDL
jgi:hypothetical protein